MWYGVRCVCGMVLGVWYLDLGPVPSSDVGDGPAGLFADGLFSRAEEVQHTGQRRAVQHHLVHRTQLHTGRGSVCVCACMCVCVCEQYLSDAHHPNKIILSYILG